MNVRRGAPSSFTAEFDSEDEVRNEHKANLAFGALRLPTTESVAIDSVLQMTLRGPWAGEIDVKATVVALLPDGIALAVEGDPDEILARLLDRPEEESPQKSQNTWDRVRALSQIDKILLAARADRTERSLLLQDTDPRVLLSVLRNPRLTVEEVVRLAKSASLNYQIAEVIMKTGQWMGSLDVRVALIHNAKTPQAFALRILPTLPDYEVKAIARGGSSTALKQAALRRLQK